MFPSPQRVDEHFGKDETAALKIYIKDYIEYIYDQNTGIREELLPRWIRTYRGTPAEEERTFPWPGASNLIIQVAATHADELLSRVMAIYQQELLFRAKALGADKTGEIEDQREILEEYLTDAALDPEDLDLYRVEEVWFASTIRYGTGVVKFPWEETTEKRYVYLAGVTGETGKGTYKFEDVTKRDGPHPENIPLNLFGIDLKSSTLANSDGFYHVRQMNRTQVQNLLFHPEVYYKDAIEKILAQPDRNQPDVSQQAREENKKPNPSLVSRCTDQWDIYEFWFKYWKDQELFNLIAYYHKDTDTHLGCIFNVYPENLQPFEDAKLAYDDDTYHGFGFMEMVAPYQNEISGTHNWRMDNRQFSTTGIGRVNKNSKLSSIMQIHPGILIPADKDEVEWFQQNSNAMAMGVEDEQQTLALAKERTGVDPAMGGSGGGVVNSKRGIYSAQGTAAVMQVQNNRNNLRMSDMRSAHVKLGRKVLRLRAEYGLGTQIKKYGDRATVLAKALENYKSQKLGLIIKPASASSNKELEKQNDILMSQTLEKQQAAIAQALQAYEMNKQKNPELAQYFLDCIKSTLAFSKHMLRNFNYDDVGRLIAVPASLQEGRQNAQNATGRAPGAKAMAQQAPPQQGSPAGNVPIGGGEDIGGVPQ
jgi:hypothetical protein